MTIKIIKRGTLPGEKEYSKTCPSCYTEFTFLAKDAQTACNQRDGSYLKIACPLCFTELYQNV